MSIKVVRAGRDAVKLQFVGAELVQVWGPDEEAYGDGVISLSVKEAIELAKELLEAVLEKTEEEEKSETA